MIDDYTIKAYKRLINNKILNPMIYELPLNVCIEGIQILTSNAKCTYLRWSVETPLYLSIHGVQGVTW